VIGLGLGWLLLSERNRGNDNYDYRTGGYRYYEDMEQRDRMADARDTLRGAGSSIEHKAAEIKFRAGETAQEMSGTISDAAHRAGETISENAQRAGESITDKAQRVGESVSGTAEAVQERAGDIAMRTREEADRLRREAQWRSQMAMDRTRQSFRGTMDENPLALGAVLVIAGAAIGAAIPTTEYENRLMGETRDRLLDEAKGRAQDAVDRVQTVVEDTQRAAVSEAKSAAQRQNLSIGDMESSGMSSTGGASGMGGTGSTGGSRSPDISGSGTSAGPGSSGGSSESSSGDRDLKSGVSSGSTSTSGSSKGGSSTNC
jgi:hypothetical protein